jgi:putative ABC transport system ATP-binding protein
MKTTSPIAVRVEGVTKVFHTAEEAALAALNGVDLEIRPGEFVSVMGPSGSGKSTLLHLIGGLDQPTTGRVYVDDVDLATLSDDALTLLRRRRIGFVFQSFNLLDTLTAQENVALPLLVDGVREAEANRRAAESLERVGLLSRLRHYPSQLSGGEQQRVAIARALVIEPLLLLADEPTGNLDSARGDEVLELLRRLTDEHGQTLLLVTHDAGQAARADRLVRLRDGRVVEIQDLTRCRPPGQLLRELKEACEDGLRTPNIPFKL